MNTIELLTHYLGLLSEYAGRIAVPGLERASRPLPLDLVYIEPRVHKAIDRPISQTKELGIGDFEEDNLDSAATVLHKEERLVFLGEPGQGKTTLLRQYARRLIVTQTRFPLLVELGRFRRKLDPIGQNFEWLRKRVVPQLAVSAEESSWLCICELLRSGKAAILLDGLDELNDDARRQLRELIGAVSNNQVVVSSRPHVYRTDRLSNFSEYHLADLSIYQVKPFAENVCRVISDEFGSIEYQSALNLVLAAARGQAAASSRNPLFLLFLCLTAVTRMAAGNLDEFPTRPASLIGECVSALVEWQRTFRKPQTLWPSWLDRANVIRILGPLAVASFVDGSAVIKGRALGELSEKDRNTFDKYLLEARFVEQQNAECAFPLETFREYFAAQSIAQSADPIAEVRPYLHAPEWQKVIHYVAGSLVRTHASRLDLALPYITGSFVAVTGSAIGLIAALLRLPKEATDGAKDLAKDLGLRRKLERGLVRSRQSSEFFITSILRHSWRLSGRCNYEGLLRRDLYLATHCIGNAQDCPEDLVNRVMETILTQPENPGSYLASAIVQPRVEQRVLEMTHDDSREMRLLGARALTHVASRPQVQARLLELTRDQDSDVRRTAISALDESGSQTRRRQLELTEDEDPDMRIAAIGVLEDVASEAKVQERLLELTADEERSVVETAVRALDLSQPEVQERLLGLIQGGGERTLRLRVRVLRLLGGLDLASQPQGRERLMDLIVDEDVYTRLVAASLLSSVASQDEVRDRLLELTKDEISGVRSAAMTALKGSKHPQVQERWLELTEDCDPETREIAARSLRYAVPQLEARKRLLDLSKDRHTSVRRTAVRGLKDFASEDEVRERLLQLTRDKDEQVRANAVLALEKATFDSRVIDRLLELSESESSAVRNDYAQTEDDDLMESLLRESLDAREIAIRTLGRVVSEGRCKNICLSS